MEALCPEPALLCAYQAGTLEESERDRLELHLSACPPCRETVRTALEISGAGRPAPVEARLLASLQALRSRPRTRRPAWAAAAGLLLVGSLAVALRARMSAPPHHTGPAEMPEAGSPLPEGLAGPLGGEGPRACLARGMDVLIGPGGRVMGQGRRLRAESGDLWVEVSRGEPAELALPGGGSLTLGRGLLALSLPRPPAAAWLLREADAAEPAGEVWLLEGEAGARLGDQSLRLEAGEGLVLGPEGWVRSVASPERLRERFQARAAVAASLGGREIIPSGFSLGEAGFLARDGAEPPSAYRWVTVLSRRRPGTEVRFSLPAAGRWYDWTAGMGGKPPAPREVVELVWDGEWLRGRLDGRLLFAVPRERLDRELSPSGRASWALSVWGGAAVAEQSRLQEVP